MDDLNFKDDWDDIPDRGILPEDIKGRIWSGVRKRTLNRSRVPIKKLMAASIVLFMGVAIYYAAFNPDAFITQEYACLETYDDSVQFLRLPDGSRVWINENTKLKYPKTFNGDRRTVTLEGEAYFEVAKNDKKPFVIQSKKITMHTEGGSFQLNTRESREKVWVANGTVLVDGVILKGGDTGIYEGRTKGILKQTSIFNEPIWKQRIMDVEGYTLAEILKRLKKDYQFDVAYKHDSIKSIKLRGTLIKQPLDSMLITLSYALKLDITSTKHLENSYTITVKPVVTNN